MPDKPAKPSADSPKTAKSRPRRKTAKAKRSKSEGAEGQSEGAEGSPKPRRKPGRPKKRLPQRQTFLVAATIAAGDGPPRLRVYAAVVRDAAEALEAVRAELGPEVALELTGKLSNRVAKALGLKPDEVRPV